MLRIIVIFTAVLFISISSFAEDDNLSPLDQAYVLAMENADQELDYYNLFLNSELFIPVHSYKKDESPKTGVTFDPILMKTDGVLVLMLFDSLERLRAWGNDDMAYVSMPGRTVVEAVGSDIHWALNVGTGNMKVFAPEELQWLKELINSSKEPVEE